MAEEHEEREDASAGVQLKKFITDAMSTLDSIGKRMDAMEERERERKDAHRKDDDDSKKARKDESKEEEKEEREDDDDRKDSTVIYHGNKAPSPRKDEKEEREDDDDDSHKRRKDALPEVPEKEEEKEERAAADKRRKRKDDDRKDTKEEREDDDDDSRRKDSRADSSNDRVKRLEEAVGDIVKVLPKSRSDEDYHMMCDIQARADEVYSALGQRSAPRFLDGEDAMGYRRRLVRNLKKHSPDWKDVNIHGIVDETAFSVMERRVYADAMAAASAPVMADPGTLRAVTHRGDSGHMITEYVGEPRAWMDSFAGPVRQFVEGRISARDAN